MGSFKRSMLVVHGGNCLPYPLHKSALQHATSHISELHASPSAITCVLSAVPLRKIYPLILPPISRFSLQIMDLYPVKMQAKRKEWTEEMWNMHYNLLTARTFGNWEVMSHHLTKKLLWITLGSITAFQSARASAQVLLRFVSRYF